MVGGAGIVADKLSYMIPGPFLQLRDGKIVRQSKHCPFPSLNAYLEAGRTNRHIEAKAKNLLTDWCAKYARRAAREQGWEAPSGQVSIALVWQETSWRRDADNVAFSAKFVLDGLVWAGCLTSDSPRVVPQPPVSVIERDKTLTPGVWVEVTKKAMM